MYHDKKGLFITHIGRILISLVILSLILTQNFSVVITENNNYTPMAYLIEGYNANRMLENDSFISDFFDGDVTNVSSLAFAGSCLKNESSLRNYQEEWKSKLNQLYETGKQSYTFMNSQLQLVSVDTSRLSGICIQLILASAGSLVAGVLLYLALIACIINIVGGIISLIAANKLWGHPEIQKEGFKYSKGTVTSVPCLMFALALIIFQAGTLGGLNAVMELQSLPVRLQVVTVTGISPILWALIVIVFSLAFEYCIQKRYTKNKPQ